jgi:hypothetical protein
VAVVIMVKATVAVVVAAAAAAGRPFLRLEPGGGPIPLSGSSSIATAHASYRVRGGAARGRLFRADWRHT